MLINITCSRECLPAEVLSGQMSFAKQLKRGRASSDRTRARSIRQQKIAVKVVSFALLCNNIINTVQPFVEYVLAHLYEYFR